MRFTLLSVAVLFAVGLMCASASAQDDPPPLHTERGLKSQIVIEKTETPLNIVGPDKVKVILPVGVYYEYHRFMMGGVLHGSQARKLNPHPLDDFQLLTAANPWENLAALGAVQNFDMRQEPLTYHHRTGPIGAIYSELRTRKNGADAKAPVAVLGLTAGTQACYAQKGQQMTFYETDPVVKKLVADTDKYFSYVADARKRGAEIEIRVGDKRTNLKADKGRKYALIVVDIAESFPFCTDIFTKEAVQEYFDRMTDDGLLTLHISNKYIRLEPMIAALANDLKLTARVWNDDAEGRHGKTASSWVVLARNRKALGDRLCSPISDLMTDHYYGTRLIDVLVREYPALKPVIAAAAEGKQREEILNWLDERTGTQRAQFAAWIRKYGSENITLMDLLKNETGHGFRPLEGVPEVIAWTDARADVYILWMSRDVQAVRRLFGYPTPIDR